MFTKEIETLLQKSLPFRPMLLCQRSLKHDIDDLMALVAPAAVLAVVDDHDTAQALGDQVFRALKGRFECMHVTLGKDIAADEQTVDQLRRKTAGSAMLVAVGSGTISDLCKYASFLDGKPYLVFPTAASMNGYLSANASITMAGMKKTLPAHMPKAVFCDLSVIAAAPSRLSKSGLGDSLARPTAQADWLLSHLLLDTAYDDTPFTLLAPIEPHLFEQARGIALGDPASIELLMQTLLLSGLGMTIAHGSYPASGSEHLVVHAYGMMQGTGVRSQESGVKTLHGEDIGVTALAMAQYQENMLRRAPHIRPQHFDDAAMTVLFGAQAAAEAKKAYRVKQEKMEQAGLSDEIVATRWEAMADRIENIMLPSARIEAILNAAHAPATPQALGWDVQRYQAALTYARFLRDRFTFLDVM